MSNADEALETLLAQPGTSWEVKCSLAEAFPAFRGMSSPVGLISGGDARLLGRRQPGRLPRTTRARLLPARAYLREAASGSEGAEEAALPSCFVEACRRGDSVVVRWLSDRFNPARAFMPYHLDGLKAALRGGQAGVAGWLLREFDALAAFPDGELVADCCAGGNVALLETFMERRGLTWAELAPHRLTGLEKWRESGDLEEEALCRRDVRDFPAFAAACEAGQVQMAQHLLDKTGVRLARDDEMTERLCRGGQWHVLEWLAKLGALGGAKNPERLLTLACRGGDDAFVVWLAERLLPPAGAFDFPTPADAYALAPPTIEWLERHTRRERRPSGARAERSPLALALARGGVSEEQARRALAASDGPSRPVIRGALRAAYENARLPALDWIARMCPAEIVSQEAAKLLVRGEDDPPELCGWRHECDLEAMRWLEAHSGVFSSFKRSENHEIALRFFQGARFASLEALRWALKATGLSSSAGERRKRAVLAAACACHEDPAFPAFVARFLELRLAEDTIPKFLRRACRSDRLRVVEWLLREAGAGRAALLADGARALQGACLPGNYLVAAWAARKFAFSYADVMGADHAHFWRLFDAGRGESARLTSVVRLIELFDFGKADFLFADGALFKYFFEGRRLRALRWLVARLGIAAEDLGPGLRGALLAASPEGQAREWLRSTFGF
jgi:hypothetical protein